MREEILGTLGLNQTCSHESGRIAISERYASFIKLGILFSSKAYSHQRLNSRFPFAANFEQVLQLEKDRKNSFNLTL
jgi:hypothetical protein